jgi:hypothetical protein
VEQGVGKGKKGGREHLRLFVSISVHVCVCVCLSVYWLSLLTPPHRPPSPGHSRAAKLSEGSCGASATERGSNMWEVEPHTRTHSRAGGGLFWGLGQRGEICISTS